MLLSIMIQLLWGSGYLMDYYVNTDYYKEQCVNKDIPELNCDGKCLLAEKIKQQQQESQEGTSHMLPITTEYTFSCSAVTFDPIEPYQHGQDVIYFEHYAYSSLSKVFKPPI